MELYTIKEVAKMLGMSPRTIQQYVRDGKLDAIKWSKGYRIKKESVIALILQYEGNTKKWK